jgi:uncharacterized protein involved in response to NO
MGEMDSVTDRARSAPAPVFLSIPFRPFFLLAGLHGLIALAAWVAWLAFGEAISSGEAGFSAVFPPAQFHAHEMLFGYGTAAFAGFLLTAVPSWTGARPLRGRGLLALAGLWLLGRLGLWASGLLPGVVVAVLDLLFLPALALPAWRGLMVKPAPRNLIFLGLLAGLFLANLLSHLDHLELFVGGLFIGHRLGLDIFVLLIAVVGGRIVPAFTTNALRNDGETRLPAKTAPVEAAAIGSVLALLLADLLWPEPWLIGTIAAFAALAHAWRLAGWRGVACLKRPILWILHVSYLWLVVGLALRAAAELGGLIDPVSAFHALAIGTIGGMTLGIMTRAALGHTGRPLVVAPSITAAYLLISLAAVLRVLGANLGLDDARLLLLPSGLAWVLAYLFFLGVYWPILTGPRIRSPLTSTPV